MLKLAILLGVLTCSLALKQQKLSEDGTSFFLIGDFGWVRDLSDSWLTFGKMNEIRQKASESENPDPRDLIDFFITVGDNLYPHDDFNPTDEEFDQMMELFALPYLNDLIIYAVRGNHDGYFDAHWEIDLMERYENWYMPSLYYKQEFPISNGKKLGVLFLDSNFVLCSEFSYANGTGGLKSELLHEDLIKLRDTVCDEEFTIQGDAQYEWTRQVMAEWQQDESVIWKGVVLHHPMWGKWYVDYHHIIDNLLPLMMENKFDFYFAGHEHVTNHAYYEYDQVKMHAEKSIAKEQQQRFILSDYVCGSGMWFQYGEGEQQYLSFKQGEAIHQIITGTTGYDLYHMCPEMPSMGRFLYYQNIYHAFSQVTVTESMFSLRTRGVDPETNEIVEIHQLDIFREAEPSQ